MNDDIELLVERLNGLLDDLRSEGYVTHRPEGGVPWVDRGALAQNVMIADRLEFEMFGGVSGSVPVAPALDRARMRGRAS